MLLAPLGESAVETLAHVAVRRAFVAEVDLLTHKPARGDDAYPVRAGWQMVGFGARARRRQCGTRGCRRSRRYGNSSSYLFVF